MSAISPVFCHRALALATLLMFATAATAQSLPVNTTDLGQTQPRTVDLSMNPNFHVYVFVLNGIRYVQVNDLQNTVRATFAVANGQVLPLPSGVDSQQVSTQIQPAQSNTASLSQAVYSDSQIQVVVIPQSAGYAWAVLTPPQSSLTATKMQSPTYSTATCNPQECNGADMAPAQLAQ
ncbi:hypothetical protein PQR66_08965 [Paraburkholderia agricolaris]|jgi:hypothetical protein|uniref:Uncharacterized protein n=1 Tax=Paraburkholderia agricolaris TaxID=2152888 RepID=A0ABW8ZLG9_9BURK